ncbi:putative leucine-rich, partial [Triplophysa rosa]
EETPRERADKEEMDIHIPSYPLPQEIQQMDQSEKACRYCGVSYLILHEFQRLQERLQEVERELERARGSVERERAVREELRQAFDHLEEMKAAVLQQEETTRALDLQLCVVRHEMESVRTDKERVCTELENEHARRLHLRWRCEQQQQVLGEALALLKSSRGEMMSIKSRFTHFQENWEDSKALIQQSCISADAEFKRQQQKADGVEAELNRLQGEVPNLTTCLDAAQEQILQLDSQVQTQKLLQNENQEAWSLIQGLREEMKTLNEDLQNNMHEREHVKELLETKSAEKEELQELWSQQARDQKATMERLSRDLREKEESWLSCQQRCESLKEQLLAWQQKEEEVTRRLEQAEAELKDLRVARSTLQQERKELRRIHVGELERLEESFRTRLEAAEEHNSKMEACLEQKQAEQVKQLKQLEMELRREAVIELDIQRQKNQELLQKYQTENQQLQKKIPAIIHSATQELHEEIAVLQERMEKQGEARESASQREQQVLQVQREGEAQLQSALQDLQQAQKQLQQFREEKTALEKEKYLLEETVRRECEEREELTSALTLAGEQLLDLKHLSMKPRDTQTHTRPSRSTLAHPDPPTSKHTPILLHHHPRNPSTPPSQGTRRKSLGEWHSGSVSRSLASWHETSRPVSTLPKINKDRIHLVNDSCKNITTLLSRRDKL